MRTVPLLPIAHHISFANAAALIPAIIILRKPRDRFKEAEPKTIRGQLDKIRDSANEVSQDMRRAMEEQQKAKRSKDDGAR